MKSITLLLLGFLGSPLLGQTAKSPVVMDSAQHRANKRWQATFGPGHAHPFFGVRARFSLFLDRDSMMFLDLSGGTTWNGLSPLYSYSKTQSEGRKLSLGSKLFLSNSFYVEGTGFYRIVARKADQFANDIEFSSQAVGMEFLIGNQWQWNRFTLGCDWIGVHVPLSVFGEKSRGTDSSEYFQRKSTEFESFSKRVSLILAGFYIGFSF
jgi:hypothetical protein